MLHTTPSTVVTLVSVLEYDVAIRPFKDVMLGNLPAVLFGANIVKVSVSSFIGIR